MTKTKRRKYSRELEQEAVKLIKNKTVRWQKPPVILGDITYMLSPIEVDSAGSTMQISRGMLEQRIDDKLFVNQIREWLKAELLEADGKVDIFNCSQLKY